MFLLGLLLTHVFSIVEQPKFCLKEKKLPCSIWSKEKEFQLDYNHQNIYLKKGAILEINKTQLNLIQGKAYFRGKISLLSAYANFMCETCWFSLEIKDKKAHLTSIDGTLMYQLYGSKEFEKFPSYSSTYIYPVSVKTGKASLEVVSGIIYETLYKDLELFTDLQEILSKKKKYWQTQFRDQRFISSQAYMQAAQLQLREEQDRLSEKKTRQEQWAKEREDLRKLYRKKNYLE